MKEAFGWKANLFVFFYPIMAIVFKNVEYGAQTSIYCAVSPDLNSVTGKIF